MNIDFLKKEIGGLPVWAWLLVGVGGVGIGLYVVKSKNLLGGSPSAQLSGAASTVGAYPTGTMVDANGNLVDGSGNILQAASNLGNAPQYPTVPSGNGGGNIPILPSGYTPIYDNNGNIVGYNTPPSSGVVGTPIPPVSTSNPTTGVVQTVGGKFTAGNPLIPYGKLPANTKYVTGAFLNYGGQVFTEVVGSGGRLYGVPGMLSADTAKNTPVKTLLYAPGSFYH